MCKPHAFLPVPKQKQKAVGAFVVGRRQNFQNWLEKAKM
jgi:hypothetical protein